MNLVVNPNEDLKAGSIEGEILSTNGRVKLLGLEIPPYPKILHLDSLNEKMIAQKKVNGYNVRLTYIPQLENFIAVLRGGYVCAKTTSLLRKHFSNIFMDFFKENQKKILCVEVFGKKSLANLHTDYYKENYGLEDAGYFVFDVMDTEKPEDERFLSFEKLGEVCKKYSLNLIPPIGIFDSIEELNKKLQNIPSVFEGAVVKSLDGRQIFKYRFDDRPDIFSDKLPKKEEREKSQEEVIVAHFFQGYEEREMGLDSGITQEEMEKYQKMLDEMKEIITKDKSKIGEQSDKIAAFLVKTLNGHGVFEDDLIKRVEKLFKQKIGAQVGKILKMEKR